MGVATSEVEVANPGPADPTLVTAAPLTARNVVYAGDDFEAFAASYCRRNPKALLTPAEPGAAAVELGPDGVDLVVLGPGVGLDDLLGRVPMLRTCGALVLRQGADIAAQISQLSAAGLRIVKAINDAAGTVWVAIPEADAAAPRLHVEQWAFAPILMDIRTRLPMAQLDTDPRVTAHHRTRPFTFTSLPLSAPKIIIAQRPGRYEEADLREFMATTLARGWVPVLETDDHPGVMARVTDRQSDERDWLSARAMAAVQTSTPKLAAAFARHNPEVKVFGNAVFDLPPFPDGERTRRVFYGAVSRGPFAVEVARSLSPVVRQFPDLEFVVVGDRAVFEALPTARKRFEGYVPYERYLALMRQCSVTLSPLAGRPYEDTKSDAKFLDAAQSGALLIASPTVYGDVVKHGVNGLIARRRDHWAPLLADALRNGKKRRDMARRAWEDVREHRMFANQIAERRDWYLDLWTRREALEQALCERLPGLADQLRRLRA